MANAGDITKLPKWAQRRIKVLEMRLDEAKDRLRERMPDESYVQADPWKDQPLELGDPTISFKLDEPLREHRTVIQSGYIQVRRQHGGLYVMASTGLAILPQSTNTATLRLRAFDS